MPTRSRIAAALISSAYTPAILAALVSYFFIPLAADETLVTQAALVFGMIFTLALLHALILGLPLYLLLRRSGNATWLPLSLAGFVAGVIPLTALVIASGGNSEGLLSFVKMVLKLGTFGALGGLTFWWVLTRMRTEKAP